MNYEIKIIHYWNYWQEPDEMIINYNNNINNFFGLYNDIEKNGADYGYIYAFYINDVEILFHNNA